MPQADAAHLLELVSVALDGFESDPLPASVRRSFRIARLNGDEAEIIRFSLELDYDAGAAGIPDLDASDVHRAYLENRSIGIRPSLLGMPDYFMHSTEAIDLLVREPEPSAIELSRETQVHRRNWRHVRDGIAAGIRSFTWDYLTGCETQLRLSTAAERIFNDHRLRTDALLGSAAPVVLDTLTSALDRARFEADHEARVHALLSCRRVLVAVADVVFPARDEPWTDGQDVERQVGALQYRNRLLAGIEEASAGATHRRALAATLTEFAGRLDRLDNLLNRGVHDQAADAVTEAELRHGVIHTYLLAGEVLELCQSGPEPSAVR